MANNGCLRLKAAAPPTVINRQLVTGAVIDRQASIGHSYQEVTPSARVSGKRPAHR